MASVTRASAWLKWAGLGLVCGVPLVLAANSSLLAWRDPVYIAAGFAGVLAMAVMVLQPLLAIGKLPGFGVMRGRQWHRLVGSLLVLLVIVHVIALWLTSPPDVVDVLLFASPTPFSIWGVVAMWALFGSAVLAATRRRFKLPPRIWRLVHTALFLVIVIGSVGHALLIEGTMETVSKIALCGLLLLVTLKAVAQLRVWKMLKRPKS